LAANTAPIFLRVARASWSGLSTSAVTGTDGTDANVKSVFTADATNGSKVEDVYINVTATNNAASVVRFWVNNGAAVGTGTNNSLIHEEVMPLQTLTQTTTNAQLIWRANVVLAPGYKLLAAAGVANGGIQVTCVGGDY
jgi:hypothetical protein